MTEKFHFDRLNHLQMNFWSKIQILLAKVKQKSALQIFIGVQEGLQKSFWTKICIIQKKYLKKSLSWILIGWITSKGDFDKKNWILLAKVKQTSGLKKFIWVQEPFQNPFQSFLYPPSLSKEPSWKVPHFDSLAGLWYLFWVAWWILLEKLALYCGLQLFMKCQEGCENLPWKWLLVFP